MDSNSWKLALTVAIAALEVAAAARAVWRSQGVERTLMWLFAIVAFPGAGAAAYFLLANPRIRRTTRRKRAATGAARQARAAKGRESGPSSRHPLFSLAAAATGFDATQGNAVELLAGSDRAFERIEETVRSARKSVWAEYYLIRRDATGHRFLDLLAERARAGVEVRLLYDAVGSMGLDAWGVKAIVAAGGGVQAFLPLNPLKRRWSFHLRNHRKLIVVDGAIGFTGGMNVGDEYSGRARRKGKLHFRDSHVMFRGPAVRDLADVFIEDWAFATGGVLESPVPSAGAEGQSTVAVLPSGPDQERNASALAYFAALGQARERAWLTSPYFIPDEPTLRALECAALRGVDVRLLVPARGDVAFVGAAARSYFPNLLQAGVRIFTYLPSMLHAKTMVVDGEWCIVGSANLDIRSFRLNFELSALIHDAALGGELDQRFRNDLRHSREENLSLFNSRGPLWHALERAARLLSPLL